MSYQQPQDYYTHSNASQYDDRYQQGAYRDDAVNYNSSYPPQNNNHYSQAAPSHSDTFNNQYSQSATPDLAAFQDNRVDSYNAGESQAPLNISIRCRLDLNSSRPLLHFPSSSPSAAIAAQKYSYAPAKKPVSKWVKYGIPAFILILIIAAGAALGGYFGTRSSSSSATSGSSKSTANSQAIANMNSWTGLNTQYPSAINSSIAIAASKAAQAGGGNDLLYSATDIYGNPMFSNLANDLEQPSMGGTEVRNCGADPWTSTNSTDNLRPHPRIFAAQYEWDCLPSKIANDAYLTLWNATIFQNATAWYSMPPVEYIADGGLTGSGILDPAREVQQRVKAWGYAYRISNNTMWVDRMWTELQTAAGNTSQLWGQGNVNGTENPHWNPQHFLDTAELTAAYGIAYDWLYDVWTQDQKTAIMWSIINLGLQNGVTAYNTGSGWFFTHASGTGNWNCVCNGGLLTGALAIKVSVEVVLSTCSQI